MVKLLRAEWTKVVKNHVLTSFLVWVFPIGMAAFYTVGIIVSQFSEPMRNGMTAMSAGAWTVDVMGIWGMVSTFPANVLGRMLPLAFMAVVFAGEYEWGTWKNIVPRGRRLNLLFAKLVVLSAVVMLGFSATSLVVGVGQVLSHRLFDQPYGPDLTTTVVFDFLIDYGIHALIGLMSLLILAGFAAISAVLTRSILGGLLMGFGFSVLEPLSLAILLVMVRLFQRPSLINLYRFTPSYNLENLRAWLLAGQAHTAVSPDFTVTPGLDFSTLLLSGWIVGLFLIAATAFQRQDITS